MKIVRGNKTLDFSDEELIELAGNFNRVVLDLGTGDGRFVYKSAIENPGTLYIGVDPSEKQLQTFSKKVVRKKLENALFIVGSIEVFPNDFEIKVDTVVVNFPWGSLMEKVVRPDLETVGFFKKLLKSDGGLELTFGYSEDFEPTETTRLNLPEINEDYVREKIVAEFEKSGFKLTKLAQLSHNETQNIQTTWSKKLTVNKDRIWFYLSFSL